MSLQTVALGGGSEPGADRRSAPARAATGSGVPLARILQVALLLVVAGQLGRVPLVSAGSKEAPLLLNDVLVMGLAVAGALVALRRRELRFDAVSLTALLFIGIGGLSAVLGVLRFELSAFEAAFSLAYLARWSAYFAVYLVLLNAVRPGEVGGVWRALEAALLIFAGFGVLQSLLLPDFAFLVYPDALPYLDWDPQGHRLVSTFLDPNFAGIFIVLGLLVYGGRLAFGARVSAWKVALLGAALVLTLSRSSAVALVVGAGTILLVRGSSRRLLKVGAGLAVAAVVSSPLWLPFAASFNKLSLDDPSAYFRVVQWGWALTILSDNPLLGVGFNTYGFVSSRYDVGSPGTAGFGLDGGVLFIAVMTGVLGSLVFVVLLALLLRSAARAWRRADLDPASRGLALGAGAAVPAVAAHSFFANTLLYAPLLLPLWTLWGCAAVLGSSATSGREDPH